MIMVNMTYLYMNHSVEWFRPRGRMLSHQLCIATERKKLKTLSLAIACRLFIFDSDDSFKTNSEESALCDVGWSRF